MKSKRNRQAAVVIGTLFLPLALFSIWLVLSLRQDSLDHQLVQAITSHDADMAIQALESGANPNHSMSGWEEASFKHRLLRFFSHPKGHHDDQATAFLVACGAPPDLVPSAATWFMPHVVPNNGWPSARLVKAMLAHGALSAGTGGIATQIALVSKSSDVVSALAEGGVDLNHIDSNGHSALMLAAAHNDADMITQLIKLKAKINQQDSAGYTALTLSLVYAPQAPVVEELLTAGADPNLTSYSGDNALSLCSAQPDGLDAKLGALLRQHGAKPSSAVVPSGAPPIASVLGVTVGKDDLSTTGTRMVSIQIPGAPIRPPLVSKARHALQIQTWPKLSTGGYLTVNALDINNGPTLPIQTAFWMQDMSGTQRSAPPPQLANLCWMNGVRPGMTMREVESVTSGKLPPPEKQGSQWIWYMAGKVRPLPNEPFVFTRWWANLSFQHDTLTTIIISCYGGPRATARIRVSKAHTTTELRVKNRPVRRAMLAH